MAFILRGFELMPILQQDDHLTFLAVDTISDWDELLAICGGHLQYSALNQLRHALQGRCRTIVVEHRYVCKDYRDTYTNWYAKKFATYPDKCSRLLFFRDSISGEHWWNVPSYAESFIGYSVIRPTRITCIGRTILDPEHCSGVQGYMCVQEYRANLLGERLTVKGLPHITQDTDVTVCAHAAC